MIISLSCDFVSFVGNIRILQVSENQRLVNNGKTIFATMKWKYAIIFIVTILEQSYLFKAIKY